MAENRSKLTEIRIIEGWSISQLAAAARISAATLKRAEDGRVVREYIWGKILQGVNNLKPTRDYKLSDLLP